MDINIPKLQEGKKIYFASDFHLGAPNTTSSIAREKRIVNWLKTIATDAQAVILVGDLFDFWFEYKHAVPKGHIRFLGQLAAMSDTGINIIIFVGNHDLWLKDYLKEQIGATIIHQAQSFQIGSKKFYIAHGDGLNPKDHKFRIIKKIFTNPFCQWLFGWLHPNIGIGLANAWSGSSREKKMGIHDDTHLVVHSRTKEASNHHDYYVYGDCHVARRESISETAEYYNLGDWITNDSFACYDGQSMELCFYQP